MAPGVAASRSAPPEPSRALAVPPPWRIVALVAALICAVVVTRNVFTEAHQVIGWAVASSILALLLHPVVQLVDRHAPRALAIVGTFVMVIALGVGVTWLYSSSVLDQVAQIQEAGPAVAAEIEERDDRIGEIAREIALADQVTELTARLDERTGTEGDAIRSAALSAPPYFVSMILTIFLLLFGPRIVRGAIEQLPPDRRGRVGTALREGARRTQVYVWAAVAQAAVSGIAIGILGSLLDVPAVGLLALFGAVVALVPYVGLAVGWLPVLVLGLGVAPAAQLGVAVCVAIALQLIEWRWWRPFIDARSLHVGPAVPVIVAIVGFGVYGIGGALYGCALAVLALAIVDQLAPGDDELPTPLDEPDAVTAA